MNLKRCKKCKAEKQIEMFYRQKAGIFGVTSVCKECSKIYSKKYYLENKERLATLGREWHKSNKESVSKRHKKNRLENLEAYKATSKKYYSNNKKAHRQYCKKWAERNPDKIKEYAAKKNKNLNTRIGNTLRSRVRDAVRRSYYISGASIYEIIGCNTKTLKIHLESQFKDGMTWDNYGMYGWHIDHIKPCAAFDLTDIEEQKKCFHYSNMQPLWADENIKKGAKYPQPEQAQSDISAMDLSGEPEDGTPF
jgi:hypothetical protein